MKILRFSGLLFIAVLMASCGGNRLDVDVSSVNVQAAKINRFADDLFTADTLHFFDAVGKKVKPRYGEFYNQFTAAFLCSDMLSDTLCADTVLRYVKSRDWRYAWEQGKKTFDAYTDLEAKLTDAYRYFKFHFPKRQLPASVNITMCGYSSPAARFFNPVLRFGNDYSIPSEMYLGASHDGYAWAGLYAYQKQQCVKENIVPDFVRQWMRTEFRSDSLKKDFLTTIIAEGRLLYLTDALLRDTPDSLKFKFTGKQLEWCEKNEAEIWATFVKPENQILYSIDDKIIRTYVDDGPFTTTFQNQSPAHTGCWIGYRIVKKYMDEHPEVTLQQLMDMNELHPVYFSSGYKPKF